MRRFLFQTHRSVLKNMSVEPRCCLLKRITNGNPGVLLRQMDGRRGAELAPKLYKFHHQYWQKCRVSSDWGSHFFGKRASREVKRTHFAVQHSRGFVFSVTVGLRCS